MIKYCPDCGEELVLRENRESGESFYACSDYPECCYTESINDDFDDGFDERRDEMRRKS